MGFTLSLDQQILSQPITTKALNEAHEENAHLTRALFKATSRLNRRIYINYCSSFLLNNSCCTIFHSKRTVFYKQEYNITTNACFSVFTPISLDKNWEILLLSLMDVLLIFKLIFMPAFFLHHICNKSMKLLFQLRGIISLQIKYCLIKVILIFDLWFILY